MDITSDQIRAARALLRLEQRELARRARLSVVTVRRLESGRRGAPTASSAFAQVRKALEEAGAEFIANGVRRRPVRRDARALYDDLRAISLHSAARLEGREPLTDADLYDADGLPA
jgi:transcriptional regulator with XRE-family HTH domain